jgi:hypothetical protein
LLFVTTWLTSRPQKRERGFISGLAGGVLCPVGIVPRMAHQWAGGPIGSAKPSGSSGALWRRSLECMEHGVHGHTCTGKPRSVGLVMGGFRQAFRRRFCCQLLCWGCPVAVGARGGRILRILRGDRYIIPNNCCTVHTQRASNSARALENSLADRR